MTLGEGKLLFILITKGKAGESNEALNIACTSTQYVNNMEQKHVVKTKHDMMKNEKDVLKISELNKLARKMEVSV